MQNCASEPSAPKEQRTIYCVIPTHNRLNDIRNVLELLDAQSYPLIEIVVINDGSSDGTGEFLNSLECENITVLNGDSSLWWGGAMRLGMSAVSKVARETDFLLMLNDDMTFHEDYLDRLVCCSDKIGHGVVGSVQRCAENGQVLSIGYQVDFYNLKFKNLISKSESTIIESLPGRGTLLPMIAVHKVGLVNARLFPHYLSDLEYFSRLRDHGFTLTVDERASIYTSRVSSDVAVAEKGLFSKSFNSRSKNNIFAKILFFTIRGPIWLRVWCIPRFFLVNVIAGIGNILSRKKS